MTRPLRFEIEGGVYHITARGNEQNDIFVDENDKRKFVTLLSELPRRYKVKIHAYVLMSNHYHLLLETPKGNISKAMHYLNVSYTVYFNRRYKRSGHLFQGRYKSIVIEKDSYLISVSRYIHLNPVRAGIVKKPEEYKWSSYKNYLAMDKELQWLMTDWVLCQFSRDKNRAKQLYCDFVDDGIEHECSPFSNISQAKILGSSDFTEEIKDRIDIEKDGNRPYIKSLILGGRDIEDILRQVAEHFNIKKDELLRKGKRNNTAKKVCLFMLRKRTDLTNEEIGRRFGINYTSISHAVSGIEKEMKRNTELKKEIFSIEQKLFKGK